MENSPTIQKQRAQLEITQAEARSFSTVLNPFFTFWADPVVDNLYSFGLQKAIETGGGPGIAKKAAEKRAEIQKAQLEIEILNLKHEVTNAYTDVYVNQEKIKTYKEIYNFLKAKYDESENTSPVDKLIVEEELINIEQQQEDSEIEIKKAKLILENLAGKDFEEGKEVENPRKAKIKWNLEPNRLVNTALKKRPEMLENDKEMELALILKKLALANRFPLVIFEMGSDIEMVGHLSRANVYVNLDMELPILGAEKKEIETAKKRIEEVKKEREAVEKDIRLDVINALSVYELAKERIEKYESLHLPKVEKLAEEVRGLYEKDEINIRYLMIAEKSWVGIQNNYFDALLDYEYAVSTLEKAVAMRLTEDSNSRSSASQYGGYNSAPNQHDFSEIRPF